MIKHHSYKIQNVIQQELFAANHSIKICVAWFTNDLLFQPLLPKLKDGVEIDIILNKDDINLSVTNKIDFEKFKQMGGRLHWNTSKKLLHHKFCIIDGRIVIAGSYNWTNKAEYNHEDITVYTDEQNTLSHYESVFEKLLQEHPELNKNRKQNSDITSSHKYSIIEYTSTDENIVTPNNDNAFDGKIVFNTYDKYRGKGIIKFDREITTIGESAFYYCPTLESVIIPDGVKSIDRGAFFKCVNLARVTIPKSVLEIDSSAFDDCKSIVNFGGALASKDGRCLIIDGVLVAVARKGFAKYIIPEGIKVIAKRAFNECNQLSKITIPNSVIDIQDGAFYRCERLVQFDSKYASADRRCLVVGSVLKGFAPYGVAEYVIPDGVTRIGDVVFAGCTNITNITIPNSVTSIGFLAFSGCESLTNIVIPNGVTELGWGAFGECVNLVGVSLPSNIEQIYGGIFGVCMNLTSIFIPNGVVKIGDAAFTCCKKLSMVVLPNSVKELDLDAFSYCSNQLCVYINNNTPPVVLSLPSVKLDCRFYVPMEFVDVYKNADNWKEYADQIFGFSF